VPAGHLAIFDLAGALARTQVYPNAPSDAARSGALGGFSMVESLLKTCLLGHNVCMRELPHFTLRRASLLAALSFTIAVVPSCGLFGAKCEVNQGDAIEAGMLAWCASVDRDARIAAPPAPWKTTVTHPPVDAVLIELTPGAVSVERNQSVPTAELAGQLKENWTEAGTWALAIAGDVPRADVSVVLKTLADSGHPKGFVLLAHKDEVKPLDWQNSTHGAVMSEIHETVSDAPADKRVDVLRAEIQKRAPACFSIYDIAKSFEANPPPPHQECRATARAVTNHLVACGCPKESDMLAAIINPGGSSSELPPVAAPATIDTGAAAPKGATWTEIVAGLSTASLGTLWVDAG